MVIISDANVIVYFWKANLLDKVLLSIEMVIPEEIFNELTQSRIRASYPDLTELINQHRYNRKLTKVIKVEIIEHESEETLALHEYIKSESGLDDGEIDGIMLSVLTGVEFVTNDAAAVEFFNDSLEHGSSGSGKGFMEFLEILKNSGIIDKKEYQLLLEAMK
ncbi:MAG: hypothetical protein IT288_02815 [Bdellovibrionales bacterium]|nr:hypothetical protein [Bdellovibrionales bacterium]